MIPKALLFILPLAVSVLAQTENGIGYYGSSNVRRQPVYRPRPLVLPNRPLPRPLPAPVNAAPAEVSTAPAAAAPAESPAPIEIEQPAAAAPPAQPPIYRPNYRPLVLPRPIRPEQPYPVLSPGAAPPPNGIADQSSEPASESAQPELPNLPSRPELLKPEPESEIQPQPIPESNYVAQPQPAPQPEYVAPEQPTVLPEPESEVYPQPVLPPEDVAQSLPAPQPEHVAQPQPEYIAQPQPAPQPEIIDQPQPSSERDYPAQALPTPEPEPVLVAEAEPVDQPQEAPEVEPDAQPQPAPEPVQEDQFQPNYVVDPLPVYQPGQQLGSDQSVKGYPPPKQPQQPTQIIDNPPPKTGVALPPLRPKPTHVREVEFGAHPRPTSARPFTYPTQAPHYNPTPAPTVYYPTKAPFYPTPAPTVYYPTKAPPIYYPTVRSTYHQPPQTQAPPVVTQNPIRPPQTIAPPNGNLRLDFQCKGENGYYSVQNECDAYIECKEELATKQYCPDGLHFNPAAKFFEYPCAYPSQVQCNAGASQRTAQPTNQCPHQYGFFAMNDGDCGQFLSCQEGIAMIMTCPAGLVFNPQISSCDWPVNVPQCNPDVFKGFTCPEPPADENGQVSEIITKYRYGGTCQLYVACQLGHPRLLSCDPGLSFDEASESCVNEDYVTDCAIPTPYSKNES